MRSLMVQRMPWDSRHTWQTLGFDMSLQIFSDSSAARAFASLGLGRQRHVQTRYLWLQERVAASHLTVQKVKTTQNAADILTKAASRETLERHRKMIGLRHVEAHRSQTDLRLSESLDAVVRHFVANQHRFRIRLWYCRGCWIDWNAQDNDANVNTVDEQELGATRCWSGLKWNSSFRRAGQWTSIRTQLKPTRLGRVA